MESYDLDAEEAIRLSSLFLAIMRQSDANLRMPQSAERRAQTLAILSGMFGAIQVWCEEAKIDFAQDFVAEIARPVSCTRTHTL